MKIQVNSGKTIAVDARLIRFVEGEVRRALSRFATRLTRVEVHLSDVDGNKKTGQADKRCLIEVRPERARPVSVSAKAAKMAPAIGTALDKMRRRLTTSRAKKTTAKRRTKKR
jgi:ribosomal subunit interface protein